MNLQERLIKLCLYKVQFTIADNTIIVCATYPSNWQVTNSSENKDITTYRDEKNDGRYIYEAPLTTSIDTILDEIEFVIKTNREIELKVTLLANKIEELKDLFLDNDYTQLRELKFVLPEKTEKASTKTTTKTNKSPRKKGKTKATKENTTTEPKEEKWEDEPLSVTSTVDTDNMVYMSINADRDEEAEASINNIVNKYIS